MLLFELVFAPNTPLAAFADIMFTPLTVLME
jgi:hypothetical protein